MRFTFTRVLIKAKLQSYFLLCALTNTEPSAFWFFNDAKLLRISLNEALTSVFYSKRTWGSVFHYENYGKLKASISTELHELQNYIELYIAILSLNTNNIQQTEIILGITRNYFTPCRANQLTGFYMMATLAFNDLNNGWLIYAGNVVLIYAIFVNSR